MEWITVFGVIAAILVNVAFLPQIIKSWKTKKTEDISLLMYLLYSMGVLMWLIYGIIIKNVPIIISDSIGIFFVLSVLYLKIKHG